ncbi:MAG: DUF3501 family protein [Microthrixaceae bacterium]
MTITPDEELNSTRKLKLNDIADLREYERTRDEFRSHIISLKKRRRVGLGLFLTLLFENRETILFQIQEMARAEKILSDEGILSQLAAYNPLIPEPGTLSATLFLELTSEEQLREWLPKLLGIQRSLVLRFAGHELRCVVDEDHEAQLTREDITASVHYIRFEFSPQQVADFATAEVELVSDHPEYIEVTVLTDTTVAELAADLQD